MSALRLTLLHTRYALVDTIRTPIAVISSLAFPALVFAFFVIPQRTVAEDPEAATQAVIQIAVFAVMSNALFSFGLNTAQARETPWDPYLRTLPAPGIARMLSLVFSTGALGLVAVLPVVALGAFTTAATASAGGVLLGLLALAASALPFMFTGIAIGYAMSSKVAIAIVQVVMFGLAFGGGLFLPPFLFPAWLDAVSRVLPSRQAREVVIHAVQGGETPWWAWGAILAWTIALLALALVLYRRDEGRRFR